MSPFLIVLLVLVIGIAVGVAALRLRRPSWLTRQVAGGRRAEVTSALVGIAGAFIGFHIAALAEADTIILLLAALVGAGLIVWGWREIRF